MTRPSIWQVLGLEQTQDRVEIRRAYARRLKVTNPEDDESGFQTLRAAYEQALAYADQPGKAASPAPIKRSDFSPDDKTASPKSLSWDVQAPTASESPAREQVPPDPMALYFAACRRLEALVTGSEPIEAKGLLQALDTVLLSPVLQDIGVQAQTDQWLAKLIVLHVPRSDLLLDPVIERFKWTAKLIHRKDAALVRQAVSRRDDLLFLNETKDPWHAHHAALMALTGEPGRLTLRARLFAFGLPQGIESFLDLVRTYHPTLMHDLNSETVAEWDRYFSCPRHPAWALWSFVLTPLAFIASAICFVVPPAPPVWGALFLAVPLAALIAILRIQLFVVPRMIWLRHPEWRASIPLQSGWVPATGLLLVVAALLPPNSVVLTVITLLAAAIGLWAAITGELDVRDGKYPWPVRMVMVQAYLVIWWAFIVREIPPPLFLQMTVAFAAAVVGSCFGTMPLFRLWLSMLQTRGRILSLIALGALVAGTGCLLWLADGQPVFKPLAAAAVVITVLLHRVPALGLRTDALKIRHYTMWFLGIALLNLGTSSGFGLLSIGGAWLLTGVTITVVGGLAAMKSN